MRQKSLSILCLVLAAALLPAVSDAAKSGGRTILIDKLRYHQAPDHTRVVLELTHAAKITRERIAEPNQVVIHLLNVTLSNAAKRKAEGEGFPRELEVKQQAKPPQVQVILDMEEIADLKLQTLTKPYRLVVDYTAKNKRSAPRQPKVVLPPMSRQTQDQRQARLDIDTIVIDPGHGGKDPGAIGRSGMAEKDVVLDVGLRLRELLKDRLGKQVLMTRDRDVFVELDDRAKFANGHKADLFVSIHVNSHPHRAVHGVEMYHFGIASDRRAMEVAARENGDAIDHARDFLDMIKADLALSKRIEESQNLAWETKLAFVNLVGSAYQLEDHGVKTAPFYVLRYTVMPSILAELSFISNAQDEKRLRLAAYRQKVAEGLFEGIRNYLNSTQIALAR